MLLIMECFGNHLLKIKLELIRCGEVSQSDAAGQNIYSVVARPVSTFNNPWTVPQFYFNLFQRVQNRIVSFVIYVLPSIPILIKSNRIGVRVDSNSKK